MIDTGNPTGDDMMAAAKRMRRQINAMNMGTESVTNLDIFHGLPDSAALLALSVTKVLSEMGAVPASPTAVQWHIDGLGQRQGQGMSM